MQQIFTDYCGKETSMEGKAFAKLAKDLKLTNMKFTATDVDLIFAKIKDKSQRRVTYKEFLNGLELIA